ncbi:MAG TPA: hypothetical protein DEQ28_00375 [Clostridiales bacterium]|nr:hypothetical protein [Clostridiales bacterium]
MTLDPHQVTDYNTNRAVDNMFNRLVEFVDGGTDLRPGLAERWVIEDGGLTYVFHLRRGVKFHDGEPFNAEAVEFSLLRQIDPNHPYHGTGEFAYAEYSFGMIDRVEVLDEYTVKITLNKQFAPFLSHLAMQSGAIVSPVAVKKHGRDFSHNPVGTGPFRFQRWEPGVEVVLERNPDYWAEAPVINRVIFRPVVEDQARVKALEAGELSFIVNIPPDDLDRLQKDDRFTVMKQAGMHVWHVILNCATEPFDDVRVRQAVNYAIDSRAIVDGLLRQTGVLAVSPLPPVVWGHTDQVRRYELNLDRARQLLAEALPTRMRCLPCSSCPGSATTATRTISCTPC